MSTASPALTAIAVQHSSPRRGGRRADITYSHSASRFARPEHEYGMGTTRNRPPRWLDAAAARRRARARRARRRCCALAVTASGRATRRPAAITRAKTARRFASRCAPGIRMRCSNAVPPSPTATMRPVTNCDDDGAGSLRAVLAATASGDTVDLSGLTCSSISLRPARSRCASTRVTLEGPATRELTIDGNDVDRVFLHYGAGTFMLRNLTVRDGRHRATRLPRRHRRLHRLGRLSHARSQQGHRLLRGRRRRVRRRRSTRIR